MTNINPTFTSEKNSHRIGDVPPMAVVTQGGGRNVWLVLGGGKHWDMDLGGEDSTPFVWLSNRSWVGRIDSVSSDVKVSIVGHLNLAIEQ